MSVDVLSFYAEGMEHAEYVESLRASAREFARVVVDVPLDTAVPSCPGWTIEDLMRHLGDVHRWARSKVTGDVEPDDEPSAGSRTDLLTWFEAGAELLVADMSARSAEDPCWTIYPPAVVGTWARRQALETAIHLWDACVAVGHPAVVPASLATSGVAEVVEDLYPRQVRLGRIAPLRSLIDIRVTGVDGEEKSFALGAADASDSRRAAVELAAEDALLLLWKRRSLDETDARVSGADSALKDVLGVALVP